MRVLVVNTGSSSIKASVLDLVGSTAAVPALVASAHVEWADDPDRAVDPGDRVRALLAELEEAGVDGPSIEAVAHRIVHGGAEFTAPVVVDDTILAALERLGPLAPLHNPVAVRVIGNVRGLLPGLPNVAVFDTAFHATLPEVAWRYPVPDRWTSEFGVRRYGFHGLSVQWSTERAAALLSRPATELAIVVAHLGNGCSATAVLEGRSRSTSMGMTPYEGLMMGTRAGSIDPGILLQLLRANGLSADELADDLAYRSGMLGVSGSTGDVRLLVAAAAGGADRARLALEMFSDRAAAGIAAMATVLPRLDGIVFTGGIGEHAGTIRAAIARRLAILDVRPITTDESGSDDSGSDRILEAVRPSAPGGVPLLRIEAREDIVAARAAQRILGG